MPIGTASTVGDGMDVNMPASRWRDGALTALWDDYTGDRTLTQVAALHNCSLGTIARLAKKHHWPPRRPNAKLESRDKARIERLKARIGVVEGYIGKYQKEHDMLIEIYARLTGGDLPSD